MGGSTRDRSNKDGVGVALVSGGAGAIGKEPIGDSSCTILWDFRTCSRSLSPAQASTAIMEEPRLPLLIALPQRLTAVWCLFMIIP